MINLDRASAHCKNFKNPLALATGLFDCGLSLEHARRLAVEHGWDSGAIAPTFLQVWPSENESARVDSQSTQAPATEAASFGTSDSSAAANDLQDLAPVGVIRIVRDWQGYTLHATAAGLAQWCRENHAPDVKPAGTSNAPNLGFLLTLAENCSGEGHPKKSDVVFTHGCSLDLDKITRADIEETLKRTVDAGYAAVFWESHSSTEAEPAGRLLLILDPPCPADQHARVYELLRAELCPWAPGGQHNVNRGWNPPRASADVIEIEGTPVDWQDVIARAPKAAKQETRSASAAPVTDRARALGLAVMVALQHPVGSEDGKSSTRLLALGAELIHRLGLTLDEAVDVALQYYDPRCTNAAGEPYPWGESEIRRGFESASKQPPREDQLKTREWLAKPLAPVPGTPEHVALMAKNAADQAAELEAETQAKQWKITRAADLCSPLPSVPWLCKGLGLAPGRPNVVTGSAGSGKTMAMMDLALSVASGKPVFGEARLAVRQGAVLHIDVDQGAFPTKRRYQQLAKGRDIDLAAMPLECIFWQVSLTAAGERKGGVSVESVQQLTEICAGKALCIIDSLRGVAPDMEENSSEFGAVLQKLSEITDATGCAFVVLHHDGHNGRARGTTAIKDRAGSMWQLVREESKVAWECGKVSEFATHVPASLTTTLDYLGQDPEAEGQPLRIKTVAADAPVEAPVGSHVRTQRDKDKAAVLLQVQWKDRLRAAELISYFDGAEGRQRISKNRIEDALRELVLDRKLTRVKSGKSCIYQLGGDGTVRTVQTPEGWERKQEQ